MSTDPVPDSALPHPSSRDQPASYREPIVQCRLGLVRLKLPSIPLSLESTDGLETPMSIGKPAPCVRTLIDAVDQAMRQDHRGSGLSARQRSWLAFCVTAPLVTHAIGWARFARASRGTDSMAALSWMFRPSQIPWDHLLVASVRVILRPHGIPSGSLVMDDTDNARSKAAKTLAYLYKLRDKASGG